MRHIGFCLLLAAGLSAAPARAADPTRSFDEATRYDLGVGVTPDPRLAFRLYVQAANAGLPEAEFNVAVMLDSGRGVEHNIEQAAIWYARAAAHGNSRAAYNLGQLYEAGQGVPPNTDLARAWYAASHLAAARARVAALHARPAATSALSAPTPITPNADMSPGAGMGGVELVWVSQQQPEAVRFFVEIRALDASGSREVFSGYADISSVFAEVPDLQGDYAWRVLAVARQAARYAASDWLRFSVTPK